MNPTDTPGWISTRHLQHMVARGEAAGVAVDELLAEAGLDREVIRTADAPVPLAAVETLLAALSRRYADPLLGLHLASDIQPATFGAIGYISQSCTTLGDVIDVAVRYNGLLSNIGKTAVTRRPGLVEVSWACAAGGPALRRQATEYVIGAFVVLARLLLPDGGGHLLQSVHFAHAPPGEPERVREYFDFFRCPVYFGRSQSAVVIPSAQQGTRLRHGDAFMKDLLERHAQDLLRERARPPSLVDDVRRLVTAMTLDGLPGKDAVARQLGMSARSLHRRLDEAGSGYREILDGVRLEQAQRRLAAGEGATAAIAIDLGFSSPQAFLRWFRSHTGDTPGAYRRRAAAKGESVTDTGEGSA